MSDCRLYLITPPSIIDVPSLVTMVSEALEGGDVACIQVRLKDVDDDTVVAAAKALLPIAHEKDCVVLVNDRADLAAAAEADGVHLGQSDGDVASARTLLGHTASIGVTCHDSMHLAFEAGEAGADYVAFGAFYPTETKVTEYQATPDLLTKWAEVTELPCVAIGGITPETAGGLAKAGADFIAVSSAVWQHPEGPKRAVAEFNAALQTD